MKTEKVDLKTVRAAFDALDFLNNITWTPYLARALATAILEEKEHRGFGPDFNKHHPNACGVGDAARLFIVKRIAEYLSGKKFPRGRDFLNSQISCFHCAGLVDAYRKEIRKAWAQIRRARPFDLGLFRFRQGGGHEMKPQIILDAEQNWPEDEAALTADTFKCRMADSRDDEDREWNRQCLVRDRAHMHKVFGTEPNATQLVARYDAALAQELRGFGFNMDGHNAEGQA